MVKSYNICPLALGLFHGACCLHKGSSVLQHVSEFHSFFFKANSPLYVYSIFPLSVIYLWTLRLLSHLPLSSLMSRILARCSWAVNDGWNSNGNLRRSGVEESWRKPLLPWRSGCCPRKTAVTLEQGDADGGTYTGAETFPVSVCCILFLVISSHFVKIPRACGSVLRDNKKLRNGVSLCNF